MSRGGGGRGGRGGGGRGGFGGGRGGFSAGNAPPMGLTFAEIQSMSREPSALYPPMDLLPMLTGYSEDEKRVAQLQQQFKERLRKSPYYIVENVKSTELSRYSDKYRAQTLQPPLRKRDLNKAFFPPQIFDEYFNPRKKQKTAVRGAGGRFSLEELPADDDTANSGDERSEASSQPEEDYDVDEEYDNDYAGNYFDNGEGDDFDNLDGGGVGGDEGGGADYD